MIVPAWSSNILIPNKISSWFIYLLLITSFAALYSYCMKKRVERHVSAGVLKIIYIFIKFVEKLGHVLETFYNYTTVSRHIFACVERSLATKKEHVKVKGEGRIGKRWDSWLLWTKPIFEQKY